VPISKPALPAAGLARPAAVAQPSGIYSNRFAPQQQPAAASPAAAAQPTLPGAPAGASPLTRPGTSPFARPGTSPITGPRASPVTGPPRSPTAPTSMPTPPAAPPATQGGAQ
jgi:hypothetical protein